MNSKDKIYYFSIGISLCVLILAQLLNNAHADGRVICNKFQNMTNCNSYDENGNLNGFSSVNNNSDSGWTQDYNVEES